MVKQVMKVESGLTRVTAGEGIGAIERGWCPNPRIGRGKAGGSRIAGHIDGLEAVPNSSDLFGGLLRFSAQMMPRIDSFVGREI